MGRKAYPGATELMVAADGGGNNVSRSRLWKSELQLFSDRTGLTITICHFPPGTSKWNKIEHRMFSHITQNWRGRPLVDHETIVQLIGSTRTSTGLVIRAGLDEREYPIGSQVSDSEIDRLNIVENAFHGDWNYTIFPRRKDAL